MEVILLQDIYKHGVAGEIVSVADGFARNYLIPRKMAVKATKSELKRTQKIREQVAARRASYENMLNDLAREINGTELIFGRRAAITGKLFGSVTTQEVADALMEATGVDINRRRISQQSLREIGTHDVAVRLGNEISPMLKIIIVREEELAEFLAARERGEEDGELTEEQIAEGAVLVTEDAEDMETEVIPRSAADEIVEMAEAAAPDDEPAAEETPADDAETAE